jgi:hypothetical protein
VKFDWHHFDSSVIIGETIERYPILDWKGFYNPRAFVYGRLPNQHRHGFTGEYYKAAHFAIVLFRHEFGFSLEWGHGKMSPEQAKTEYHAQRRAREK